MTLVREVCDYVYVLDFGTLIFEGTPEEMHQSHDVRAAYLGDTSRPAIDDASAMTSPSSPESSQPMLTLTSVTAGYGGSTVLRDVNLTVAEGEVVALLGPNGAGKTTLLRTATGLVTPRSGTIALGGEDLTGTAAAQLRPARHLPRAGGPGDLPVPHRQGEPRHPGALAAPSTRRSPRRPRSSPSSAAGCGQTAGSLSGGEQQMLALSRAYLTRPKLVLVDEASFGLAPLVVDKIYDALALLAQRGISLIIVEQYVQRALDRADTVYILSRGEIVHSGSAKAIAPDEIYEKYLGIE